MLVLPGKPRRDPTPLAFPNSLKKQEGFLKRSVHTLQAPHSPALHVSGGRWRGPLTVDIGLSQEGAAEGVVPEEQQIANGR